MNTTALLLLIIGLLSLVTTGLVVWVVRLRRKQTRLLAGNQEILDMYRSAVDAHKQERDSYHQYQTQQHEFILACQGLIGEKNKQVEELLALIAGAKQRSLN